MKKLSPSTPEAVEAKAQSETKENILKKICALRTHFQLHPDPFFLPLFPLALLTQ